MSELRVVAFAQFARKSEKTIVTLWILNTKNVFERKGVVKARETLKDIHDMIVELDVDPNNSIRLMTENTDFPSLNLFTTK